MKNRKLLCALLTVVLIFSIAPLTALATDGDITINLVDGEAIYFYLDNEQLYVKSGDQIGQPVTGTVNLVGNNVTIPKIYAGRDVGIKNVTISGSNITISEGITASEGWGSSGWANGNPGPSVSNLTIDADYVTINGGINGGKGGDAAYYAGKGGDVTDIILSGSQITIYDGINGGIAGESNTQQGTTGIVSDIQVSSATYNAFMLNCGADNANIAVSQSLTGNTDITEAISGKSYISLQAFANAPTGIAATACTTAKQNDGKLTGVNSTMEYKLSTDTEWIAITSDTVTDLKNGTYEVRMAATDTFLVSSAVTVTVGAFVEPPPTGNPGL